MPKSKRNRIGQRGQVEVNDSVGVSGVPAAIREVSTGGSGGSHVGRTFNTGLTAFSSVLSELAAQARRAEDRAEAEATYQRRRAERKADEAAERAARREEAKLVALELATTDNEAHRDRYDFHIARITEQFKSPDEIETWWNERSGKLQSLTPESIRHYVNLTSPIKAQAYSKLYDELEAKTTSNLYGALEQDARTIFDTVIPDDYGLFESSYDNFLIAAETGGVDPMRAEETFLTIGRSALLEKASHDPENATLILDSLERLRPRLKNKGANLALDGTFIEARKGILATRLLQDQDAKKKEDESYRTSYLSLLNGMPIDPTPEYIQQLKGTIAADPESFQAVLGEEYYNKLIISINNLEQTVILRDSRKDQVKLQRDKDRVSDAKIRYREGDSSVVKELLNSDVHPGVVREFLEWTESEVGKIGQLYSAEIEAAERKLLQRFPREGALYGVLVDGDGTPVFDPYFARQVRARFIQAVLNAHRLIDPSDMQAVFQRDIDINKALEQQIDNELNNINAREVQLDSKTKAISGGARPKIAESFEPGTYPLQQEDIRRGLFSGNDYVRTGKDVDGNYLGTNFNKKFFDSLPPDARRFAADELILRAGQNRVRATERATNSIWWSWQALVDGVNVPGVGVDPWNIVEFYGDEPIGPEYDTEGLYTISDLIPPQSNDDPIRIRVTAPRVKPGEQIPIIPEDLY